jgi:uncharacterized protein with HEPN domain
MKASTLIAEFVKDMNFSQYIEDRKTQAAVERKIAVISEAAVRLRDDAERLVPEIPWRDIRGIGNWLRHQYDRVNPQTVWNTIHDDLPPLKTAIESYFRDVLVQRAKRERGSDPS